MKFHKGIIFFKCTPRHMDICTDAQQHPCSGLNPHYNCTKEPCSMPYPGLCPKK